MQEVFTKMEVSQRTRVEQDLLNYFRDMKMICVEESQEDTVIEKARRQILKLECVMTTLELSADYAIALLVDNQKDLFDHIHELSSSLKGIVKKGQQELPQLDRQNILCIQQGIFRESRRPIWIWQLEKRVLPHIAKNPNQVSTPLSGALPAFLKLLKREDTDTDRETLRAYEQYYRQREPTRLGKTNKARIMPMPTKKIEESSTVQQKSVEQKIQPRAS